MLVRELSKPLPGDSCRFGYVRHDTGGNRVLDPDRQGRKLRDIAIRRAIHWLSRHVARGWGVAGSAPGEQGLWHGGGGAQSRKHVGTGEARPRSDGDSGERQSDSLGFQPLCHRRKGFVARHGTQSRWRRWARADDRRESRRWLGRPEGAVIGAGEGTAASAATEGEQVAIYSQTKIAFALEQPLVVGANPTNQRSKAGIA